MLRAHQKVVVNGDATVNGRLNGITDAENGAGVRADASSATGSANGIEAVSNAPGGHAGVFTKNNGGTAVLIDGDGVALEANGDVVVNGRLNVPSWTQVTAAGNTGATATCPEFTTVVFGLYWHQTDTGAAQKTAFGACTPGANSCSVSAVNNTGDDEVRVWMLCGSA